MTHEEIGEELHIPRTTVSSFLQRLDERGSEENLPRPGGPRKSTATADRYLIRVAESNTRIPLAELRHDINSELSERTIRRRLKEEGIRKWKAVERALLTKAHAQKRLKWAKAHRHWQRAQWEKMIASDECSVRRDSDPRAVWVFRRQTKHEKYTARNVKGKSKQAGISIMIWGCFAGTKLGPIEVIHGNANSDVYITLLSENLIPFVENLTVQGVTDIIFQQDNASIHVSKKTRTFFDEVSPDYDFTIMDWPPNSPDMNPIEHLWAHLKTELHRRFPDTVCIRGGPETVKRILEERLRAVWGDIGEEVLERLLNSMSERVKALIAARGWYTDY